uniref:Uncharacterized protein n=1 Tax=Moniliophthora roreri TaxID=221103 RepID=A0A0W0FV51_MONRR
MALSGSIPKQSWKCRR